MSDGLHPRAGEYYIRHENPFSGRTEFTSAIQKIMAERDADDRTQAELARAGAGVKPGDWLNNLTSAERKEVAVSRGLFAYFPDALALIARHSVRANEKHNPGEPVHWARHKSTDQEDCIGRHSLAVAVDPDSLDGDVPHMVCRAWRALAALQLWAEAKHARGEKL